MDGAEGVEGKLLQGGGGGWGGGGGCGGGAIGILACRSIQEISPVIPGPPAAASSASAFCLASHSYPVCRSPAPPARRAPSSPPQGRHRRWRQAGRGGTKAAAFAPPANGQDRPRPPPHPPSSQRISSRDAPARISAARCRPMALGTVPLPAGGGGGVMVDRCASVVTALEGG